MGREQLDARAVVHKGLSLSGRVDRRLVSIGNKGPPLQVKT